jgi:hypothetical protein
VKRKIDGRKWVKPLSKLIIDFGLAKAEYPVEFREGVWRLNGQGLLARARAEIDAALL